jgi:hypothetical protein
MVFRQHVVHHDFVDVDPERVRDEFVRSIGSSVSCSIDNEHGNVLHKPRLKDAVAPAVSEPLNWNTR